MKHHNSLQRTLKKIWHMPVKVISVVVGALGATPIKLKQWLSDIGIIDIENSGNAEKHRLIFCKDRLKYSWDLRSLVDTEPEEIKH